MQDIGFIVLVANQKNSKNKGVLRCAEIKALVEKIYCWNIIKIGIKHISTSG